MLGFAIAHAYVFPSREYRVARADTPGAGRARFRSLFDVSDLYAEGTRERAIPHIYPSAARETVPETPPEPLGMQGVTARWNGTDSKVTSQRVNSVQPPS
jgi:hypothetical protein